jgi:Tol biopolymer transport system component
MNDLSRWLQSGKVPRLPGALPAVPGGVAPALSVIGLAIVGAISLSLLSGTLPTLPGSANPGPARTPTPSNVVITDPRADVPGSIVYVKAGNIWVQGGEKATQLTSGGRDSMPTWSADGQWIYFIRFAPKIGHWPVNGQSRIYELNIPSLDRIHPDGTGVATILSGNFSRGSSTWSFFIREPSISPNGKTAAVITDGPDPTVSDTVLKFVNLATGTISNPQLFDINGLGHQDPAWSPDGRSVLFVREAREGALGAPVIVRYDISTKKTTSLTGAGYMSPAWSPDGRFVAATKTDAFGTDIVVLNAKTGAEMLRLTNDENSFSPVWSPAGDSIAFFRVDHGVVDLELTKLNGTAPQWTVGTTLALTIAAGLDASSRPSWYIPADQLPTPAPTSTAPPASATP